MSRISNNNTPICWTWINTIIWSVLICLVEIAWTVDHAILTINEQILLTNIHTFCICCRIRIINHIRCTCCTYLKSCWIHNIVACIWTNICYIVISVTCWCACSILDILIRTWTIRNTQIWWWIRNIFIYWWIWACS